VFQLAALEEPDAPQAEEEHQPRHVGHDPHGPVLHKDVGHVVPRAVLLLVLGVQFAQADDLAVPRVGGEQAEAVGHGDDLRRRLVVLPPPIWKSENEQAGRWSTAPRPPRSSSAGSHFAPGDRATWTEEADSEVRTLGEADCCALRSCQLFLPSDGPLPGRKPRRGRPGKGNAATVLERLRMASRHRAPIRPRRRDSVSFRWPTHDPPTLGRLADRGFAPYPGTSARGTSESLSTSPGACSRTTLQRKIDPLRTFTPKVTEIQRAWYVVDADGLVLGRLASEVARILRGKHRPYFAPHVDTGDHVIVINAAKVILTSNKAGDKLATATRLSRWVVVDHLRGAFGEVPDEMIRRSVRGMLRRTPSGDRC